MTSFDRRGEGFEFGLWRFQFRISSVFRKKRRSYSLADKDAIMADATNNRMSARQVQKKYGVTPVTFYLWRKERKLTNPHLGRYARRNNAEPTCPAS